MTEKKNKFWLAWAIVAAYFAVLALTVGPARVFKFFVEDTALNNLGDFLAGLFAFPAFVLLAAAVVIQREELEETKIQLADARKITGNQMEAINLQNNIALSAASANYKVQVHDKRMVAYQRLLECESDIIKDGDVSRATIGKIYRCSADAKFVFGDVVNEWISKFVEEAEKLRKLTFQLEKLEKLMEFETDYEETEKEKEKWHEKLKELHEKQQWFFDNLTRSKVDEVLGPSLKLPEDIKSN